MNYRQIADALAPVIHATADFMRNEAKGFSMDRVEFKGHSDLVSYVDKTAEKMLVEGIQKITPDAGFILEEGGIQDAEKSVRWIIDPLDGTTNFTHNLPAWGISVAMQVDEKTVLGVVFDIPHDEYFEAIAGQGATCNGAPINVSQAPNLGRSLLATGFPYTVFGSIDDYLAVFKSFMQTTLGVRRFGSAAIDLAWTACGRFDGFYEMNLHPWDVAAGALLVQEAGGSVTGWDGTDNFVFGRKLAASNSIIHTEMLDIIQAHF